MKYLFSVNGEQANIKDIICRHNATTIQAGAAVVRGITSGTNFGFGIISGAAPADVIGVTQESLASTVGDTTQAGLVENKIKIVTNPFAVFLAEYSQEADDDVDVTSASSGTTFACTSIEDIAGGWIYLVSGPGLGQLQYITAATTNELTTKTALSPVTSSATRFIKAYPRFHQLADVNAAATKLKSAAAAGTGKVLILENFIQANNIPFQELSALAHSGLTGLDTQSVKLYAAIMFLDHVSNNA